MDLPDTFQMIEEVLVIHPAEQVKEPFPVKRDQGRMFVQRVRDLGDPEMPEAVMKVLHTLIDPFPDHGKK